MSNADYKRKKLEYAYKLTKNRKFFQKARAIIVEDKKLFTIEEISAFSEKEDEMYELAKIRAAKGIDTEGAE